MLFPLRREDLARKAAAHSKAVKTPHSPCTYVISNRSRPARTIEEQAMAEVSS
jgi:hypothetical protein